MQSPSPFSAPSPASLLLQPSANEIHDHVTHLGNPARPSILDSLLLSRINDSSLLALGALQPKLETTCPTRDWYRLNANIDPSPAKSIWKHTEPSILNSNANPEITAKNNNPLDVSVSGQDYSHVLPATSQGPQYTQALNEDLQTWHETQLVEVSDIEGITKDIQWGSAVPSQHDHLLAGMQMQSQSFQSLTNSGLATSPSSEFFPIESSMRDSMLQPSRNDWGYDMAVAYSQAYQSQPYPMGTTPTPMRQPTFWDPTQIMQSQMPTFGAIPLAIPVAQRTPCTWCMESFTRASDLQRHIESVHLEIKHHCFWIRYHNNHGKGYSRAEKSRTHQRQKHDFA